MNELKFALAKQAIQSRVGAAVSVEHDNRSKSTPLGVVVQVAEPLLEYPIELFWVDDGIPGHFTLRGDHSAELVFHTRYLVLSQYLQSLFRPEFGQMSELCERALLRFAAEFLLVRGFVDQAVQTLAKSRLDSGVYFHEPSVDPDLEHIPFGARYMSLWFSGVCHELGHVAGPEVVDRLHRFNGLSSERIELVRHALAEHFYTDDPSRVLGLIGERGDRSKASIGAIQEEARCDVFGFLLLLEAFAAIVDQGAQVQEPSETEDFLFMYLIELAALDLLEQPKTWAGWFVDGSNLNRLGPAEHRLAMSSRINALLTCVQDTEELERVAADWTSVERLSSLNEQVILALMTRLQAHFNFFESGLKSARDFMSSPEMRDVTLFERYVGLLADDIAAQREAAVFLRVADRCRRSSPQLDQMAQICGYAAA